MAGCAQATSARAAGQESRLSPALCDKRQLAGNHPVAGGFASPRRSLCALRLSTATLRDFEERSVASRSGTAANDSDKASSAAGNMPMRAGKKGDKFAVTAARNFAGDSARLLDVFVITILRFRAQKTSPLAKVRVSLTVIELTLHALEHGPPLPRTMGFTTTGTHRSSLWRGCAMMVPPLKSPYRFLVRFSFRTSLRSPF